MHVERRKKERSTLGSAGHDGTGLSGAVLAHRAVDGVYSIEEVDHCAHNTHALLLLHTVRHGLHSYYSLDSLHPSYSVCLSRLWL